MEYPNLIDAFPFEPLKLKLFYDNGEERLVDFRIYMLSDYFRQLENWLYFRKVKVVNGVVTWPNEQDIAPETLLTELVDLEESEQAALAAA